MELAFDVISIVIQIALIVAFVFVGFVIVSGWYKLSKSYRTKRIFSKESLVKHRIDIRPCSEKGSANLFLIASLAVSEKGLFLATYLGEGIFSALLSFLDKFCSPLLIPWEDIRIQERYNKEGDRYCELFLGNPKIMKIILNAKTVQQLEENYGAAIFFHS